MDLKVQDVKYADGPPMENMYIRSFFDDPFHRTLFPDMPFDKQVAGVVKRWPSNYGAPWTPLTRKSWPVRSATRAEDGIPIEPPPTPEGLNDLFAIEFTYKVRKVRRDALGDRPHLEMKMLGTVPQYRRKGAASLQLQWAVDTADKEELVCWVDASPEAMPLYHKFGFEIRGEVVSQLQPSAGGGTYTYYCMLREPRAKSR
ncbi:hypothetical protein NKR23_g8757 [Pleurostoma richardsiae]|uniref:N-acetyltransferase domain-containing protein n=1 Tax=Pleurostoma richardsiae TaxID=41990 RepID=A0AA38RI00_9PEZI|nr:hypothetical protein NKR23_g8757 [Pleurostoma richardsiae]